MLPYNTKTVNMTKQVVQLKKKNLTVKEMPGPKCSLYDRKLLAIKLPTGKRK